MKYGKNCKVRMKCYSAVDEMLEVLQHSPGGYRYWHSLPEKGRWNKVALRRRLATHLLNSFFGKEFVESLLLAALTQQGRPVEHSQLYNWLLVFIYSGDVQRLYGDWLKVDKV